MNKFNYLNLNNKRWSNKILTLCSSIQKNVGKQEMCEGILKSESFDSLRDFCKIESIKSSNEIENIRTTATRLKKICVNNSSPKTRSEKEILGYKEVLETVDENYENINLTPNYILQLHKILYKYSDPDIGGKFKQVQNYISSTDRNGRNKIIFTPLDPVQTPIAMTKICEEYRLAIANPNINPLILIASFINDFLCIHPFLDGNGRMSRILTTLLLYKSNYFIGRYISLEQKICSTKNEYYESLNQSCIDWKKDKNDPEPFIEYFLSIILSSYSDLNDRLNNMLTQTTLALQVLKVINDIVGKFNKNKLLELCPNVGVKTIERILNELLKQKKITKKGSGRSTYYIKANI